MSSPTFTEIFAQLTNAVAVILNLQDSQTLLTDIDTFEQDLESEFIGDMIAGADAMKQSLSSALDGGEPILRAIIEAYAYHIAGEEAGSLEGAVEITTRHMVANSYTVQRRSYTRGTPSAGGSNTGDGSMYQLATDQYGEPIENTVPETVNARCLRDARSGARVGSEEFEVYGEPTSRTGINVVGSGERRPVKAKSSVGSLLKNPSFSQFTINGTVSAGSPYDLVSGDSLPGWTFDDVTKVRLIVENGSSETYRQVTGDTTPKAIRLLGDCVMSQTFETAGLNLDRLVPYDLLVPLQAVDGTADSRAGTPDGTIDWRFGALTGSIAGSTLAVDGTWYPQRLLTATAENAWPRNFLKTSQANLKFELDWNTSSTGLVGIDEITLVAYDPFARRWVIIHAGETPFVVEDSFSFTDSISSDAKVQRILAERLGIYLPSAASTPTVNEPT